jgi:hypothetical protein
MSLSSSFTHFSLAELFQLIDQGRKSGCLTVCTLPDLHTPKSKSQYFYIWIRHGRVVAASNRLNGQALIDKITRRGWVQPQVIKQLCTETTVTPVGLHLKNQGILNAEQLNLLFANQLQQIRELFEIQKGVFKLDSKAILPWSEMTGLSLRAMEVALMALRVLKNWDVLADVLPNRASPASIRVASVGVFWWSSPAKEDRLSTQSTSSFSAASSAAVNTCWFGRRSRSSDRDIYNSST